jgi:hypothetical protein
VWLGTRPLLLTLPELSISKFQILHVSLDLDTLGFRVTHTIKMNRGGAGGRKVLLPPINFIFKLLQQHSTVQIWLYEQLAIRIEGRIRVSNYISD